MILKIGNLDLDLQGQKLLKFLFSLFNIEPPQIFSSNLNCLPSMSQTSFKTGDLDLDFQG